MIIYLLPLKNSVHFLYFNQNVRKQYKLYQQLISKSFKVTPNEDFQLIFTFMLLVFFDIELSF